jgi:hypothetical protein
MEIKMEQSSGISARIPTLRAGVDLVKTGNVTSSEKQNVTVSKMGMENFLSNPKIKKDKNIEIDNQMLSKLIDKCVEDLSTPRKFNINGIPTNISFIDRFDARNKILFFNHTVNEINSILSTDEESLNDFFSSFLYNNISNYSLELFSGVPSYLPIMVIDSISDKGIKITLM